MALWKSKENVKLPSVIDSTAVDTKKVNERPLSELRPQSLDVSGLSIDESSLKAPEKPIVPFPKDGVSLRVFREFVARCGGREALIGHSTTDVCEKYVMPLTKDHGESYIDLLRRTGCGQGCGPATVFVSHAWKFLFLDVLDALEHHFGGAEEGALLWFDLFGNNQHSAPDLDFAWWSTTFKSAIAQIGRTVLILAPWANPIPLTRAWCLFEIYCSIATGSRFEVAMSSAENASFLATLVTDFGALGDMVAQIDCACSVSWNPADRERIFAAVRASVGFDQINSLVLSQLRLWVVKVAQEAMGVAEREDPKGWRRHELRLVLGRLLQLQSKYGAAEEAYSAVLVEAERRGLQNVEMDVRSRLGDLRAEQGRYKEAEEYLTAYYQWAVAADRDVVRAGSLLGNMHYDLGDYPRAESLYQKCLDYTAKQSGQTDARMAVSDTEIELHKKLAGVYMALARWEESRRVYEEVLRYTLARHGDQHESAVLIMNNLSHVLEQLGDTAAAEQMMRRALQVREVKLGPDDQNTMISQQNLGAFLVRQQRYAEANDLLESALAVERRVLGESHNLVGTTLMSLAASCAGEGRHDQCVQLYEEALALKLRATGPQHPEVLMILSNLGMSLRSAGLLDRAEDCLVRAVEGRKQVLGPDHPSTLFSLQRLLELRAARGDWSGVAAVRKDMWEQAELSTGKESEKAEAALRAYAEALERCTGRAGEALVMLRTQCAAHRVRGSLGTESGQALLAALARVQAAMGFYAQAEATLLERVRVCASGSAAAMSTRRDLLVFYLTHFAAEARLPATTGMGARLERALLQDLAAACQDPERGDGHPDTYALAKMAVDFYCRTSRFQEIGTILELQHGFEKRARDRGAALLPGGTVECNYANRGVWYVASVLSQNSDGSCDVQYATGGYVDRGVPPAQLRPWDGPLAETKALVTALALHREADEAQPSAPPAVVHPLHDHELTKTLRADAECYTCNLCGNGGVGWAYDCATCSIQMHLQCAQQPVSDLLRAAPAHLQHALHSHDLVRRVRLGRDGPYHCTACSGTGESYCYCCLSCQQSFHPACVL